MTFKMTFVTLTLAYTLLCLALAYPSNSGNFQVNEDDEDDIPILDPQEILSTTKAPVGEVNAAKGRVNADWNRKKVKLSSANDNMDIRLVTLDNSEPSRKKRAVYNTTTHHWGNTIPYTIDEDYPDNLRYRLLSILDFIENKVCITFTERVDEVSYLSMGLGNACSAPYGPGAGTSSRRVSTCTLWDTMLHELFHALGAMHEQITPLAPSYISSVPSNLPSNVVYNFNPEQNASKVVTLDFDPSSIMLYPYKEFTANGLPTIDALMEDLYLHQRNNYDLIFYELNKVYECKEQFCNSATVDCHQGYYARVNKDTCQCVCPDGFSTESNCADLVDADDVPSEWPDAPIITYSAEPGHCPAGFEVGVVRIEATVYKYADVDFDDGPDLAIWTCSKSSTATNLDAMPMGIYCLIKPVNVDCTGNFQEGSITIKGKNQATSNVTNADITMGDKTVTIKYCCREDRGPYHAVDLPANTRLRTIAKGGTCPPIKGMSVRFGKTAVTGSGHAKSGKSPQAIVGGSYIIFYHCNYYVPTYDCNQKIVLTAEDRTAVIKTPGFDDGNREANSRCLYYFDVPEGSRLSLTFDKFEIESFDYFGIRRYNPWSKPLVMNDANYHKHIISAHSFLAVEYQAYYKTSSKDGVKFTVELTTKDEMCYDVDMKGADYRGNKWMTETREVCLPWTEAQSCPDFPFEGPSLFHLKAHGNRCRNPGGHLEQPWCYTYVNGDYCKKRYCDVCNLMHQGDLYDDCATLVSNDASFCHDSLQSLACPEACGIMTNQEAPTSSACPSGDWTAHGDRCYQLVDVQTPRADAQSECNTMGATLFNVRNSNDVDMILTVLQAAYPGATTNVWINGYYSEFYGDFRTPGDRQKLPYFDLASSAADHDPDVGNLFIRGPGQYEAGKMDTASDAVTYLSLCEVPRKLTFGPPELPANAIFTESPKAVYLPGEQVTLRCDKTGFEAVEKTIECGSEGWTKLSGVCGPCPIGWNHYGDRCWVWKNMAYTQDHAESHCESLGGTLFKIRSYDDLSMIRTFKQTDPTSTSGWHSWINARRGADGVYRTLDDNTPVTYFNWLPSTSHTNNYKKAVHLLGEAHPSKGYYTTLQPGYTRRFFCEIPADELAVEDSDADQCHDVFTVIPSFASSVLTKDLACSFCRHSAGNCDEAGDGCFVGWKSYKSRCYKHFRGVGRTQDAAVSYCNNIVEGGTLFRIENQDDLDLIRSEKQASTVSTAKWNDWINGKRGEDGLWYTIDDNTPITFDNWSPDVNDPATDAGGRLYLLGEDKSSNLKGKFGIEGNHKTFRFFCQYTKATTSKPTCSDPDNAGANAVESPVNQADVMSFQCDANHFYDRGDTKRACLGQDILAGSTLECSEGSRYVEINRKEIIQRQTFLNLHTAYILDEPSTTIPYDGFITDWFFYPTAGTSVTFAVFRYNETGNSYSLVGKNTVSIPRVHHEWSLEIPQADQIEVKAGDFLGMHSTSGKIAGDSCDGMAQQLSVVQKKSGVTLADLDNPITGTSTQCIYPSIGARLWVEW